MVHTSSKTCARGSNPRICQSRRTVFGSGIAREVGNVAQCIGVGCIGTAIRRLPVLFRHVGTYGDDIGNGGLVAHTHVVSTFRPSVAGGRQMVSEISIVARPHVDIGTATFRIDLNSQRVIFIFAFIFHSVFRIDCQHVFPIVLLNVDCH